MDPSLKTDPQAAALSILLLVLPLLGSITFWVMLLRQPSLKPLWGGPSRNPRQIPWAALALTGLWILFIVASQASQIGKVPAPLNAESVVFQVKVTAIIFGFVMAMIFALLAGSNPDGYTWSALGFPGRPYLSQLSDGLLGLLAAFAPVYAVLIVSSGLRTEDSTHDLLRLVTQTSSLRNILLTSLMAVVLAPLFEELVFRVVLQGWLRRWMNAGPAILTSSFLFAFVHGFPDSLGIFALALILGSLFELRRSYLSVVTLHLTFNAYNLAMALLTVDASSTPVSAP